jgi:diadenosine tetraphosphate (Ap4A) HIT family hydrolase
MTGIFSKIIDGQIPSWMLWEDEVCVSFLDVRPLAAGHALVVPREETDLWTDLSAQTAAHLVEIGHSIGRAQMAVFSPARIGLMIAGFEVPHTHVHVVPMRSMADLDFANVNPNPDEAQLDSQLTQLRDALRSTGHSSVSSR